MRERTKCEKNVIFLNINESTPEGDHKIMKEMLKEAPIDLSKIRSYRIGKLNKGKTRPLKVIFNNADDAMWVKVHNKKLCKENVKCFSDKTSKQRSYFKQILNDLENRKKNGETDLQIKYKNDIPMIIKVDSKDRNKPPKNMFFRGQTNKE